MKNELHNPNPPVYFIAFDIDANGEKNPISYGFVDANQTLQTGLSFLETFENKQDFLDRAEFYGMDISDFEIE
jgi:hypothetical protein